MEHHVDREGEAQLLHQRDRGLLLLDRAHPGDALGGLGVGVLDRDLDVLEPGVAQRLGPRAGETQAGGDEGACRGRGRGRARPAPRGPSGPAARRRRGPSCSTPSARAWVKTRFQSSVASSLVRPDQIRADSSSRGSAAGSDASAPPAGSSDARWSRISSLGARSRQILGHIRGDVGLVALRPARRRSRRRVRCPSTSSRMARPGVVQQHGALGIEQHGPLADGIVVQPGEAPERGHASRA